MLEEFKSDMMHTFAWKMDTMQVKRNQEEAERALAIFFPKCTRKHPRNECPLNVIEVFLVCEENHATDKCPSLPGLKVVYKGGEIIPEKLCFINQRRPQGPWPYQQGMQGAPYSYYYNNQSAPMQPWYTPTPSSWSTPPTWPSNPSYHPQPVNQPFQQYVPQQPQWKNPSQAWRPQQNKLPTLMPPPQTQP